MNENLEKYIKSLPILGLFISIFLMILFFFIWKAEGNLFIIFLYCLLPVIVNTSIYGAFTHYKNK